MIDVVKRGIAVVAMLALIAEPGSCDAKEGAKENAKKAAPAVAAPGKPVTQFPCKSSSQAIIVQFWTYASQPAQIRLDAFDSEGIPLIGNNGKPIANHVDTIITSWPDKTGRNVWEFPLCFKTEISGYAKMESGRTVKLGIRYFRLSLAMTRTEEVVQAQAGQGLVTSTYHFQAKK